MKFNVTRTSDDNWDDTPFKTVEIHDLKDLTDFIEHHGKVVISKGRGERETEPFTIEIYDTWRE
jgi:hypothetical protein